MKLDNSLQMLFALLRGSLHSKAVETVYFKDASESDWTRCYKMAARQGVMALAWDGVVTLPAQLQPPLTLKLSWGIAVDNYERQYAHYCRTIAELTSFYAENGISTVQLKGVGFSSLYPVPSHREGGDIDIYTCSADKAVMTDSQANDLADQLMIRQGTDVERDTYKHSNFFYKGVPIENHKCFVNVASYRAAEEVDAILNEVVNPQTTELLGGECKILTPSLEFNTLFISFHAAQHCGTGLAIHHLYDWAVLINRYGLNIPEKLKDFHFRRWMSILTHMSNRLLGTSVPAEGGEEYVDEILQDMLYPKYEHKTEPVKSKVGIIVYKYRRLVHINRLLSIALGSSLIKRICKSLPAYISNPGKIFTRTGE